MAPVAADKFISFRVDSQTKQLLQSLAAREGITESRLLRRLLEPVVKTVTPSDRPTVPRTRIIRDQRLAVRLHAEDRELLSERAQRRGVHSATYVALLLRSHLRARSPLPTTEYLALKESVAELRAVGRNLNQIARLMNQGAVPSPSGLTGELKIVQKLTPELRDRVLALLEANQRSWLVSDTEVGSGDPALAALLSVALPDKRQH
jgi:antitoxin component of RelBE/YafQ-DinJ toxin-antitoxin module